MVRGLAVIVGGLSLVACQDVAAIDRPPNATRARGLLLVLGEGAQAIAARAVDPAGDDWESFGARAGQTLYAVGFSCDLARLGLTAGPQALAESRAMDLLTPPPASVFSRSLAGADAASLDDDARWAASADLPPAVRDALVRLPLPLDARCHAAGSRFVPEPVPLPNDGHGAPAFALPLGDGRVLAGTRTGHLYTVTADGRVTAIDRFVDLRLRAAARALDGSLWFVGEHAGVWRGHIDGELTLTTTAALLYPAPQQRVAVVAPQVAGPVELYAELEAENGDVRTFARFDGAAWHTIAQFDPGANTIFVPALSWIGADEVVAIGVHPTQLNGVLRYDHGEARAEALRGPSPPSAILHHPLLGTLVGHDDGGFDRFDGRRWDLFDGAVPMYYVRVIVPEGDGFLYAGSPERNFTASAFSQYQPSIGFCRTAETFTDFAAIAVAPLGPDALLALTLANFTEPMGLVILRRTQAAGSCSEP